MIVTIFLLTILFFCLVLPWLQRRLKKKSARDPPVFPGELPLIGHGHLFLGDTVHLWTKLVELSNASINNNGVITISIATWTVYVLTDPEDCLLVSNTCLEKDKVYDFAKPWLGEGLVTASVPTWKRHRKLLSPSFAQQVLDGYLSIFNAQSKRLADTLEKQAGQGYFNHAVYLDRTSLETICLTAMGINEKDGIINNAHYMQAVNEIFHIFTERIQSPWMKNDFLYHLTNLSKKEDDLITILHNMSNHVIRKKKSVISKSKDNIKNLEDLPTKFKSFLDLLLESSEDGALSDSEIREEVDTMISAGYDTTSTLLAVILVFVGSHPDVQDKIYQELQEVFEGSARDVDKQDLPKLVYLEAVMKESLRLYPVVPIIARKINRDIELKNHTLSAGNACFFHLYGINRHPIWGADRMQFRPERWLHPEQLPDLSNAFAGFGIGRRGCLGQKFAYMSAKTTLSHILRRYKVEADYTKIMFKMDILLKPKSGHYIKIEKR